MIERTFRLEEHGTTVRTEVIGGLTTFVTLSYIVFVQPAVLATTGMDAGAVFTATCVSSAFATLLMGWWANYPIAVAPAMGHNFYFAFMVAGPTAAGGLGYSWPVALGANCIAGLVFLFLSLVGLRERLLDAIPDALKHAIAVGIGLLIALVGFEWAGIVRPAPGTLIALGNLHHPATLVATSGTLIAAGLLVRKNRAAILIGTATAAVAAWVIGLVPYHGLFASPPSLGPTFARLDIASALTPRLVGAIFIFVFLGLFDTIGTLVGVASQAGLLRDGRLPRAREAMASDALGTVVGNVLGTSTVTAYVESAAGVAAGARTGLASMVTAGLFLVALWCGPLVRMAGEGIRVDGLTLYPIAAPALIVVGSFMIRAAAQIDWNDIPVAFASFVTVVTMPFTFSITDGIAFGFIVYGALMPIAGRAREVNPLVYLFAILFLIRYAVVM
ncbi:MAG TPA: NCS2 family permease [Candidatus Binatia bacterium]|nr:NCS2 family permease [Candidatus Binatia bacterium]